MLLVSPEYAQVHWNNFVTTTLNFVPGLGNLLRSWPDGTGASMPACPTLKPGPAMSGARDWREASPPMPAGARFLTRTFLSPWGARDYRLYVPAARPQGPRGLVMMLHGCTQNADDFARGTAMNRVAERHGLLVAYPNQARVYNLKACWNWFRPVDQRRDRGEPAILAGIARALIAEHDLDRSQVFAAGLSAGGAMAAVLAATYPDVFAGVGIHSGLPHGAAHDVASAFAAMRGETGRGGRTGRRRPVRAIVFHGSADSIVHPDNADRMIRAASAGRLQVRSETVRASHRRRDYRRTIAMRPDGVHQSELWLIEGAVHAWSGGAPEGSCTDPLGPDASAEMVRFFLEAQPLQSRGRTRRSAA